MEVFGQLAGGFATALHPINMLMLFLAVVLGLVIGVLPGLGGTSGVAILLPITVFIAHGSLPGSDATTAIIFLSGIYWGALFGGVITSILFNIPGEPWAVVLLFDGFPLAKKLGKPGLALASSFVSSFVGALVSTILFTFFALPIALKALEFGPAELFAVFVLSFATLIGLGAEAPMKSLAMLALGLLLAAVGFDTITGEQRLNFGQTSLLSGISFVPVTIGLFGIGEILASAEEQGIGFVENISAKLGLRDVLEAVRELRKRLRLVLSNAIIGFFFGVLPGHGATAASFLGYGLARQYSKNKENFGKGPLKCRTYLLPELVLVVLGGGYTAGEQALFEAGKWYEVRQARQSWKDTMEVRFIDKIEELTGQTVKAFMGANHQDPDLAVELFVLESRETGDPDLSTP